MAISNFIPEVWNASLLVAMRDRLVYASLCNRNYEGDISAAGDTVRITSFDDPSVRSYTRNSDTSADAEGGTGTAIPAIQWDLLSDSQESFTVDEADYFAFKVDDVDRRQAMSGFVEETTTGASYNLASKTDSFVSALMVAGAGKSVTDVTAVNATPDAVGESTVYDLLVKFRTALTRSNTPTDGRFAVVPPEVYALLLQDDRFIRLDASGTTEGLRNGQVGRAAGFDIIESNVVPESSGDYSIVAGHSIATTFAEQIVSTEAMRLEGSFSDGIRGLHVYDAKVLDGRKNHLVKATVSVGDAA